MGWRFSGGCACICNAWATQWWCSTARPGKAKISPGLLDLLTHEPWNESLPAAGQHSTSSLAVLPSMLGLHNLPTRRSSTPTPASLAPFVSPLCTGGRACARGHAGLCTSGGNHGLAAAAAHVPGKTWRCRQLRQLKHLALHAGLVGTVACVTHPGQPGNTPARQALLSLRHGGPPPRTKIRTSLIEANSAQDLQRLALQLLENACTINASGMGTALPSPIGGFSSPIVQSH